MGKNKYMGSWSEPRLKVLDLPFTPESFLILLEDGQKDESQRKHTHQTIAQWCEAFWGKYCDVDAPEEIERIMPLLADVETQWDLHLANTYSLEELQKLDFTQISMPPEWFTDWQKKAERGGAVNAATRRD